MKIHQFDLKNQSKSVSINCSNTKRTKLEHQNSNPVKKDGVNLQRNQITSLVELKDTDLALQPIKTNKRPTENTKLVESSLVSSNTACSMINKAKKAFVKGRVRYPKRQINIENLAAVNQAVTNPMFSPFLAHLNELNLSLNSKQINFVSVNYELRKFDSKLFNKLMAKVYYRTPRRSETTSVRINNVLLKALVQTLWLSASNVKRNEFLNSTLLCMLACVDPKKATEVHKEILSNKKN